MLSFITLFSDGNSDPTSNETIKEISNKYNEFFCRNVSGIWLNLGSIKIVNGCTALPISEDLIIGHIIPCFKKGYTFMEISK